jgi:hypothetical protein
MNDRDQVDGKITRKGSLVALRTWTPGNFRDEALSLRRDNDIEADQPPTAHLADW